MPRLTPSQVEEAIGHGEITAISIDAAVFEEEGLQLETGLLRHLQQFRDGKLKLVLADVGIDAVKTSLANRIATADQALLRAVETLRQARHLGEEKFAPALAGTIGAEPPAACADRRMRRFLQETGAQVVRSGDLVTSGLLLDDILHRRPPFETGTAQGSKLIDAISLHALEVFAEVRETMLLVVSSKPDWQAFCDASDWLVCEPRLDAALSRPQGRAQYLGALLAAQIEDGKAGELVTDIDRALIALVATLDPEVTAEAAFPFRAALQDITFQGFRFAAPADFVLVARDPEMESFHFKTRLEVDLTARCAFDFTLAAGRGTMALGTTVETCTGSLPFEVILAVEGDIEGEIALDGVEVLRHGPRLDFGPVAPVL